MVKETSKPKSKPKRRYFRRKKKSRRRRDNRIPLLPAIPVVYHTLLQPLLGGGAYGTSGAIAKKDDPVDAGLEFANNLSLNYLGYDLRQGKWAGFKGPIQTYGTMILGAAGSKVATKVGANRIMKKVPLVGSWIKL